MALTVLDISLFVFGHVFTVVGIPLLVKAKETSLTKFKKLSGSIFAFALFLTIIIVPLEYIFFQDIISILAPGFDLEKINSSKGIFYYFIFMSAVYLPFFALISFFRALNLFSVSNYAEFIVSFISFVYLIVIPKTDVNIIPVSLSVGYIIGIFYLIYYAKKVRIIAFYGSLWQKELKVIYINTLKLSLWFLVLQLIRVVDKSFASLLENGMVISLTYALIITSGIGFIFDFANVYLTKLSEKTNNNKLITKAIKLYITLSIPIIIFLIVYSYGLIKLIYGYGAFDSKAIEVTSKLVAIFSPLIFLGLINSLFQSLYQSVNKYGYVIFLSFFGVTLNFLLNTYLIESYKVYGIAIATLFSTTIVLFLNIIFLKYKENININYFELIVYLIKILIGSYLCYLSSLILEQFIFKLVVFVVSYIVILILLKDEFIVKIIKLLRGEI
ncbi:polysaccharide biosynthesis C-terminal domain-containing protein [Arcobacter sp. KX21116]|uniref:lipid II flippase MurJ n=1 Tax=Arcobacter iocasae TaxID=2906515 RepID=UPI0035D4D254